MGRVEVLHPFRCLGYGKFRTRCNVLDSASWNHWQWIWRRYGKIVSGSLEWKFEEKKYMLSFILRLNRGRFWAEIYLLVKTCRCKKIVEFLLKDLEICSFWLFIENLPIIKLYMITFSALIGVKFNGIPLRYAGNEVCSFYLWILKFESSFSIRD